MGMLKRQGGGRRASWWYAHFEVVFIVSGLLAIAASLVSLPSADLPRWDAGKKYLLLDEWVSYSQFDEDIIIFGGFRMAHNLFYVDVGAHRPCLDSVTRAFYLRGSSGINVEPAAGLCANLKQFRPRDINVCAALSNATGRGFLQLAGSAGGHLGGSGGELVPVDTLGNILRRYASNRTIDWIKVDVEGHEREVLEGMDWSFRPRAWVIEATYPASNWDVWGKILMKHNYVQALHYKLNKWYCDAERPVRFLVPEELDKELGAGWRSKGRGSCATGEM